MLDKEYSKNECERIGPTPVEDEIGSNGSGAVDFGQTERIVRMLTSRWGIEGIDLVSLRRMKVDLCLDFNLISSITKHGFSQKSPTQ